MKNNRTFLMVIATTLFVMLTACGNSSDESGTTSDNQPQNNNTPQNTNDESSDTAPNQSESKQHFDVENYLNNHYSIDNTHYITESFENETTGRTDYTVKILPNTKEFGQEINDIFKNGHIVSPYEDERTKTMFNMAEQIMNELPTINNEIHVDSVNWASYDGNIAVMLIQDYENSDLHEDDKTSLKEQYLKKLYDTKKETDEFRKNAEGETTYALKKVEGDRFDLWDGLLNEIYGVLKNQLSSEEMEQLRKEQREWITYRDTTAKEASLEYKGGTMEQLEYVTVENNLTEERCFELVEDYMK